MKRCAGLFVLWFALAAQAQQNPGYTQALDQAKMQARAQELWRERAQEDARAQEKQQARVQALTRARAEAQALAQARARERILSFHSDITIGRSGELSVTETIETQVEGLEIKRGILRDFPTDYRDRRGRRVTVPFDLIGVKRDGQREPATVRPWANGVRIQIGDANVLLPHGRHVYEISYRTRYQLGFFADHDELYWNVNGNGWNFAMDSVSADVSLPRPVPAAQLKAEAYTGPLGARGREYTTTVREGAAHFQTTRTLAPYEGLTIVFSFPKGIAAPPPWWEPYVRWLHDNKSEVAGAAGALLLFVYLFICWWMFGRDPRKGPVFPRYEAPTGLGPAGTRFLDKMTCDNRCFAAALLGLGQRGFLRISQTGDAYAVERTGKAVEWLPGEQAIANLVPARGSVVLSSTYDASVKDAWAKLGGALKDHYGSQLFSLNRGPLFIGIPMTIATVVVMTKLQAESPAIFIVVAVMAVTLLLFGRWLPAYTVEGRKIEDEVEGLRQYLSIAEKDDLARLKLPPRTPEEFAKFLPYALALDVEKTWANSFAAVLGAAAVAQAVSSYYEWDSSSGGGGIGHLTDSISNLGGTISSASTSPGSSSGSSDSGGGGGGGGGSSGGGGGGGGGSGW